MTRHMLDLYQTYEDEKRLSFLSHTVDPDYDNVSVLKAYANGLGVDAKRWHFVTGHKDSLYAHALNSYLCTVKTDSLAPGGVLHGGHFLLVDKNKHIRGVYDGTLNQDMKRLKNDINILLSAYE